MIHVTGISCGNRHCLATVDYGGFYYWGDNMAGQLGNKKRSFRESPFPMNKFELQNVMSIVCGHDSSAVIVESLGERKKKKKPKRVISLAEIASINEAQIVAENQAKL